MNENPIRDISAKPDMEHITNKRKTTIAFYIRSYTLAALAISGIVATPMIDRYNTDPQFAGYVDDSVDRFGQRVTRIILDANTVFPEIK